MMAQIRFAFRTLLKAPAFALIAIITLTLGIGATTAIFSVIDTVLLRPLPFPQPERLAMLWSAPDNGAARESHSFLDYLDFKERARSFSSLFVYTRASTALNSGAAGKQLVGVAATPEIFEVLGVKPMLGRAFTAAEDRPTAESRVVIFTYEGWQRYFQGDPDIIGREVQLALRSCTVIGVMPPGFRFPVEAESEYLMPLQPLVREWVPNRGAHFLRAVGRLRSGVSVEQANAEAIAIAAHLERQYPETNTGRTARVVSFSGDLTADVRPALFILIAAVFFVLLIACANVANLLLARATSRQREIAIRTALGASRGRLVGQLLSEGFLLAVAGACGGLLLAWWSTDLLRIHGPADVPRLNELRINSMALLFTLGTAVISTFLFALLPALQLTRVNPESSLREGSRGGVGPESHRLRNLFVVSQIALSLLLLAGAGLLIKSFAKLSATDPGFDPYRVVTADFVLAQAKYPEPAQQRSFFERFLPKLASLPGVQQIGAVAPLPFSGNDSWNSFWIAGRPDPGPGNHPDAARYTVAGDYFQTMRIPLLSGRFFEERDNAESVPVILINRAFAQKFFPDENPIGQRLLLDRDEDPLPAMIVGVVGDSRHDSLAVPPAPAFYQPLAQHPRRSLNLVFRTSTDTVAGIGPAFRRTIGEMDPDVFVPELIRLPELIGGTLAQPRFNMMLLGTFAGVALALAAIGIYGVLAYSVAQRTREIGIRIALGAQRHDVLRMIFRHSLLIIGVGLGIGSLAALFLTRWMSSVLYGVSPQDFGVHAFVVVLLAAAGFIASYVPARRAMKVDPIVALRYE